MLLTSRDLQLISFYFCHPNTDSEEITRLHAAPSGHLTQLREGRREATRCWLPLKAPEQHKEEACRAAAQEISWGGGAATAATLSELDGAVESSTEGLFSIDKMFLLYS